MDAYAASEQSYKNGYKKGYEDAVAALGSDNKSQSSRKAKWATLEEEFSHWGYHDWYSDTIEVLQTIANEISWRAVMRIVHKLRRKRGAE